MRRSRRHTLPCVGLLNLALIKQKPGERSDANADHQKNEPVGLWIHLKKDSFQEEPLTMKRTRIGFIALLFSMTVTLRAAEPLSKVVEDRSTPPNIVLIFIDDLGYGDIGPFGATKQKTPHLDLMAAEGRKFTSFYAAPVCSMSRACLLTGCYNTRVSIPGVLFLVTQSVCMQTRSRWPKLFSHRAIPPPASENGILGIAHHFSQQSMDSTFILAFPTAMTWPSIPFMHTFPKIVCFVKA